MHPRRLEKTANITLKSALLPPAVFTWWSEAARWLQLRRGGRDNVISYRFTYCFICVERRSEVHVFGLERPEGRESGTRTRKA